MIQINMNLGTSKKRNIIFADLFFKIMGLTTELAATQAPLLDEEVHAYLLAWLPGDYDLSITFMMTKIEPHSLDDIHTLSCI